MKTILVPIDFSPVSRRVVTEAIRLAKAVGARVVLQHCVAPQPIITNDLMPFEGAVLGLTDALEKDADRHLRRLQRDLKQRGHAVDVVRASGYPRSQILAQAKRQGASYVVIGSHGHSAFYDLVVGSTTSGVLKRATCPVVVVPANRKGRARSGRSK